MRLACFARLAVFCFVLVSTFVQAQETQTEPAQTQAAQTQAAQPQYPATIEGLKAQLEAIKAEYGQKIADLQAQLEALQLQVQEPEAEAPPQQPVQTIPGALNPAIAVAANFVGRSDSQNVFNEDGNPVDDRLNLREAELDLRVPVDPFADAVLIGSFESETPGEFETGVEEGYVVIKKLPFQNQPPAGLKLKVGRFRPVFGKMNVLHTHDQPQTFRPLPLQEFLGDEGYIGNGISANFFLPSWDENATIDATLDVLTGGNIALSPDLNSRLSYLAHLRWFRTFAEVNNVELGFSTYWHPGNSDVRSANANAVDFLYKWKPLRLGEWKSYLLGFEYFFTGRNYAEAAESPEVEQAIEIQGLEPGPGKPKGWTVWNQWQFDRRIYAGVRYDSTETLFNPDFTRRSITPYLSYYFSEFLRFRINYEHRWSDFITEDGRNSVYFELNWIFGSHPPEPFWVNK